MNVVPTPYPEYQEQLAYIRDPEAKEAFAFMVVEAFKLSGYTPRPKPHGYITRNLHYFDVTGTSSFAFTVTQKWLLFYMRHPQETHPDLALADLKRFFPHAMRTQSGELNFRIRTIADARQAMVLAFRVAAVADTYSFPDEVHAPDNFFEGAVTSVSVNSYERSRVAREACINHYGYRCVVCGLKFDEIYGSLGQEFIHVHHLVELSSIGTAYEVDPVRDLRPVCPNCHAMLHRRSPPLSIQELQKSLVHRSSGPTLHDPESRCDCSTAPQGRPVPRRSGQVPGRTMMPKHFRADLWLKDICLLRPAHRELAEDALVFSRDVLGCRPYHRRSKEHASADRQTLLKHPRTGHVCLVLSVVPDPTNRGARVFRIDFFDVRERFTSA